MLAAMHGSATLTGAKVCQPFLVEIMVLLPVLLAVVPA
jgi:hypothetical protein